SAAGAYTHEQYKEAKEQKGNRSLRHDGEGNQNETDVLELEAAMLGGHDQHPDPTKQQRREKHIEETDVAERECGGYRREHERAPFANFLIKERFSNPSRHCEERDRRASAGHSKREFRFAENRYRQHLQPVEQNRFVHVWRAIEQRHKPAVAP